ncbi:putative prolyl 4-hydroxylase 9 [Silene latifolia]|uniref:putative prolyl 4-hydroxylase 9 n=1 Tax=Silene latifolia TaxID=37657 RepID=UPI003D77C33E
MKVKSRGNWTSAVGRKLGLPSVFFLCFFFFLLGFFGSSLISQDYANARLRARILESSNGEEDIAGGVSFGFDLLPSGDTGDDSISSIPFQVLSWRPRALYFPKFATADQCETIISIARSQLKPSRLALRKGETLDSTREIRTSSGMFISADEDKTGILDFIDEKIARATMIPRANGEAYNVLRYEVGQKYNSHYDAFHPAEYGPQKSQRIASFLLYLSDVEEGGETMFPYENDNIDSNYDYVQCIGLKVKPRQGDGLLFYSVFSNGTIDPTSIHGSCPVVKGEKWVATKWIRNEEQE